MKKLITLLLAAVMVFTLCACASGSAAEAPVSVSVKAAAAQPLMAPVSPVRSSPTVPASRMLSATIGNVSLSSYDKIIAAYAEASSELVWKRKRYAADNVIDGRKNSTWREGVQGPGKGEYVTVYFAGEEEISVIRIYPGYYKNDPGGYFNNCRPRAMTLTFSDGSSCSITLPNKCVASCIKLSSPVTTEYVKFTIDSVYLGKLSEDTCISEIEFYS